MEQFRRPFGAIQALRHPATIAGHYPARQACAPHNDYRYRCIFRY